MALSQATKEAIWLQWLLIEIGHHPAQGPITNHSDNQGSITLAKNPIHHARTKHIDICHHFTCEKIESGDIEVIFCGADDILADVLIKGLAKVKHEYFTTGIGLMRA